MPPTPADPARTAILTVDDDPDVSRAVARDLRRRYGSQYRIVRAESGQSALDALHELKLRGDQVAVILADYRMPQMNGVEFLERAMDVYPGARRILLTAYADTSAAIDAINVVDLDHYLLKPWDPPEEKLYPVVDTLLETWRASDHRVVPEIKVIGHRWSARSSEVREFLARNQVPYRWFASDEPEGKRLLEAANEDGLTLPVVITLEHDVLVAPSDAELAAPRGPGHHTIGRLLRPHRHRRRPGRPRRGRLRGVRGPADRAGGAHRDRRAGRPELPDRELPGLPGRGVRRAAHHARPSPGRQVRRGGAHHPRGDRPGDQRLGPDRPLLRRVRAGRAQRNPVHRCRVPPADRAGPRAADRVRRLLRLLADRGGRVRRQRRLHRGRRQLRRAGRGLPGPRRPVGDDPGARPVPDQVHVPLPHRAGQRTSRTSPCATAARWPQPTATATWRG